MVVVVPAANQFATFEPSLNADFVTSLFSNLTHEEVDLQLPKFSIHGATISLKDQLTQLGMTDAFTKSADFSGMIASSPEPIEIGDVLHQAFVSVDEAGTEAAAATAVIGVGTAAALNPKTVTVDRPFFFMIRDIPTNTVLFLGRVTDPQ